MDVLFDESEGAIHHWTPKVQLPELHLSLTQFLSTFKPSHLTDVETLGWIYVGDGGTHSKRFEPNAVTEAALLLSEATREIREIETAPNIPWRSDERTGLRGKYDLREEVRNHTVSDLKRLSREKGMTRGKWLVFVERDSIDWAWSEVAKSLIEGELAKTGAFQVKVSTVSTTAQNLKHVICVYFPDLYDKKLTTDVLSTLIRNVGVTPAIAKTDLYTNIGLYRGHPSGIKPGIWHVNDLLSEVSIKELRDEFTAANGQPNAFRSDSGTTNSVHPHKEEDPQRAFSEGEDDNMVNIDNIGPSARVAISNHRVRSDDEEEEPVESETTKVGTCSTKVAIRDRWDESEDEEG